MLSTVLPTVLPKGTALNGTLTGAASGAIKGTLEGTLKGTLNDTLTGAINGVINGTLNSTLKGTLNGTLQRERGWVQAALGLGAERVSAAAVGKLSNITQTKRRLKLVTPNKTIHTETNRFSGAVIFHSVNGLDRRRQRPRRV